MNRTERRRELNGHSNQPIDLSRAPILGQPKMRGSTNIFGVLLRELDENGTYEPEKFQTGPNGQPMAVLGRGQYLTAADLAAG